MVSSKPTARPKVLRGSVPRDLSRKPAPDTGWRMLKGQKAATPAPPEPAAEPETMTVDVVLLFMVDGQPVVNTPFRQVMPKPDRDQMGRLQLQLGIDARALAKLLEPHIGPSQASGTKLWLPGMPKPPIVH